MNQNDLLENIFEVLLKYNKGETESNSDYFKGVLQKFIAESKPIDMIIPAFPGKSINHNSVVTFEPDYGESLAICTLENLCNDISIIYEPGCIISLFHDGHYFFKTGCIRPYEELDKYIKTLKSLTSNPSIKHITIDQLFAGKDYDEMLGKFIQDYCPASNNFKELVLNDELMEKKYLDEYIFVKKEFASELCKDLTSSQCKIKSKELALNIMIIEAGMSKLLEERFPNFFRLSIHTQNNLKSKKFYINLLGNCKNLGTAWFNITVKDSNGNLMFMKKSVAEELGYTYVENNGLPYYFTNNIL